MRKTNLVRIPEEVIMSKIYLIRGQKVMLDMDLATLYNVETKQLKRAVKRNIKRFPLDFMFELTSKELANWRCQFGTSNREKMGIRIPPFAFSEYGILMLASILNSERAVQMNIRIIRVFIRMRKLFEVHQDVLQRVEKLKEKDIEQDRQILVLFQYLKQLMESKQKENNQKERKRIGFKQSDEK